MLSPELHTSDCSFACPGSSTWVDKVPSRDTPSLNLADCRGGMDPDSPQVARNQSRYGGALTPASTSMERSPEQPSVKAIRSVLSVWPTAARPRCISVSMAVLATAAKTCRPPSGVSTLPRRTSRWRGPASQLRMKVESMLRVIAAAAVAGSAGAASRRSSPTLSVWARRVSGPASSGSSCWSTPAAVGQEGGKLRPDLVELGGRGALRRPLKPSLIGRTAGTAEAGQSNRDHAEQGGNPVGTIIFDPACGTAGPACRPLGGMIPALGFATTAC